MKIYLAAPLFTQAERRWNRELARTIGQLKPELEIILPQDGEVPLRHGKPDFVTIFRRNLAALESCSVVVAILDGSDADSGTAWECGYAFAKGKRVIGVRTDFRISEDEYLNLMLKESSELVFQESLNEDIVQLARRIIERLEGQEAG